MILRNLVDQNAVIESHYNWYNKFIFSVDSDDETNFTELMNHSLKIKKLLNANIVKLK